MIFGNHALTHRLVRESLPIEMGAAINPVPWTPVSAGCGSPTGLRSEQACLWCACSVADLARRRVRRLGSGPKRSPLLEFLMFWRPTRDKCVIAPGAISWVAIVAAAGGSASGSSSAVGRSPHQAASFETRPPDRRWKQHARGTAKMEDLETLSFQARRCHRPDRLSGGRMQQMRPGRTISGRHVDRAVWSTIRRRRSAPFAVGRVPHA
jgi:hypothetical protein